MDFIISKVAMIICALLVVATVSGLFTDGALTGEDDAFERILDEFCDLTGEAVMGEGSIVWQVPFLPDGDGVTISIHRGTVLVESADGASARQAPSGLHLWQSDGRCVNESMVASLDEGAGSLVFESGQTVEIVTRVLTYENELRAFVFVYVLD
jgi:hypothetical protein